MEEIKKDIDQAAQEFEEFCVTFKKQKKKKLKNKRSAHDILLKQKKLEEEQIKRETEKVEREHKKSKEEIDR